MDEFEQTKCLAFFYAKRRFKSFEDKRLGILLCFSYRQAADGRTINFVPMFVPISSGIPSGIISCLGQLLPWRVKRLRELWKSECPDKKRSLNGVNLEFQVTFTLLLKRHKRKRWRFKYHSTHSNHWKAKKTYASPIFLRATTQPLTQEIQTVPSSCAWVCVALECEVTCKQVKR